MNKPQIEDAFRSALVEMEQEQSGPTQLTPSMRNQKQMRNVLDQLEWSDKQLGLFKEVVDTMVAERHEAALKAERLQTYRAKLINLSKELGISYQQLLTTMTDMESVKRKQRNNSD